MLKGREIVKAANEWRPHALRLKKKTLQTGVALTTFVRKRHLATKHAAQNNYSFHAYTSVKINKYLSGELKDERCEDGGECLGNECACKQQQVVFNFLFRLEVRLLRMRQETQSPVRRKLLRYDTKQRLLVAEFRIIICFFSIILS